MLQLGFSALLYSASIFAQHLTAPSMQCYKCVQQLGQIKTSRSVLKEAHGLLRSRGKGQRREVITAHMHRDSY